MKPVNSSGEWRIWQQNAAPLPLTHTLNAGMEPLRRYLGCALWTSVIVFEDNQGKWLFRPKELMQLGQKMIDFLLCPPFRVAFSAGYESSKDKLLKKTYEIQFECNLLTLGNAELTYLFDDYSKLYYEWYKFGWFCEPVQFQSQEILQKFLEGEAKGGRTSLDLKKALQALFALEEESFSIVILRHLAQCGDALGEVLKIDAVRNLMDGLRGQSNFETQAASIILSVGATERAEAVARLHALLQEHSAQYYWKQNNYFSTVFIGEHEILVELLTADDFDPLDPARSMKNEILQAEQTRKELLGQKAEISKLLPPYQRAIASLAGAIGGTLLDDRKKTIMAVNGAFDRLLTEAAHRSGFALEDCRWLIPQEFGDFIAAPDEYRERIEQRKTGFVVFQGDFGVLDELSAELGRKTDVDNLKYADFAMPDPFIAEDAQAETLLSQLNTRLNLFQDESLESKSKLQGVTAYYNEAERIVEGRVRVVTNPKMEQVERGEILVAPSTTPDYMNSIRRCKAIITDWGGQTSHAATIARELQKPCIIATNYASQLLRNGDLVRLHLETGVIEVLGG